MQRTGFLALDPRRAGWRLGLALVLVGVVLAGPVVPAGAATAPTVVGTGTPGSCVRQDLVKALGDAPDGGTIVFNCGSSPHTITVVPELTLSVNKHLTIDGGGLIT